MYFPECPIRILSLPCQPRAQFKQHPYSTCTTFWGPLLHYTPTPACCSGYIFLHRYFLQSLFSGFVVFNSFLKAVGHTLFFCWSQCQFNHLLLGLILSRFVCIILLLASPANFPLHRHFLHAHFSEFFTFHSKMKTKGEVFHIKSYFSPSSFAGMCTHRHAVLKGPWQFTFPVLAGLKVPVYKVKFVIRTFLPGGNYHQEPVIISSDHTMPHHRWRISIKLSPLQF